MRRISLAVVTCLTCWAQPAAAQIEPFIGQLMTNGWNFCPRGWGLANGQLLPINQNTALFSLLGTQYGGNGQTTFALPTVRPMIDANGVTLTTCIALEGIFPSRP
jgi:microcystin-dependent protein